MVFYAQKANRHIECVDHVLMNAANEGVIASGSAVGDVGELPECIKSGKYYELQKVDGDASSVVLITAAKPRFMS